jgi:pseudouridine-5'-phosphate glycosidase/pseudouridine kinase
VSFEQTRSSIAVWSYFKTQSRSYGSAALGTGLDKILHISEEVSDAVASNKPVVALETTIYTHGALGNDLNLEDIVRQHGGVPAVCGILDGRPTVGLTPSEIERMVHEGAKKVSRRDLVFLVGMVSLTR